MQTTTIDQATGLIRLTTTSGASVWRMGVVGLAGLSGQRNRGPASDGGRPDLCPPLCAVHAGRDCRRRRSRCAGSRRDRPNRGRSAERVGWAGLKRACFTLAAAIRMFAAEPRPRALRGSLLPADQSALAAGSSARPNWAVCNRAMRQPVGRIESLPAKNTLTLADAQLVEAGFQVKLATFGDPQPGERSGGRPKSG